VTAVLGRDCLSAWKAACHQIINDGGESWNLIVSIENAATHSDAWLIDYDPQKVDSKSKRIRDVVNWIFPIKLSKRTHSRTELYETYLATHDSAKQRGRLDNRWGTYFERLIRFEEKNVNQLEDAIQRIAIWKRRKAAFVFHLSDPAVDAPKWMGGPCWQFGELAWRENDVLDLVVVYRNHDYFGRAFGNFISLCALLRFICDASGKTPGKLICHSIHADFGGKQGKLTKLMA